MSYHVAYMSGPDAGTNPEAWPLADSTAERDGMPETLRPRGHREWWREVQRLEAERDRIRSETPDPATLLVNADYQFLLGKLNTAQVELLAHVAQAARLELGIQD